MKKHKLFISNSKQEIPNNEHTFIDHYGWFPISDDRYEKKWKYFIINTAYFGIQLDITYYTKRG